MTATEVMSKSSEAKHIQVLMNKWKDTNSCMSYSQVSGEGGGGRAQ